MGGKNRDVTVGYRYFLGMHAVLCQSPVDALLQLDFADRTAWAGVAKDKRISISRENLFGGKAREGGVGGYVDVEGGEPTQDQNDYLAGRLGGLVPNFRGVMSLVFRQFYFGNNPYIKPWRAKVRNVYSTFGNWQRRLAPINPENAREFLAIYVAIDNSTSMSGTREDTVRSAVQSLTSSLIGKRNISVRIQEWSDVPDRNYESIGNWDAVDQFALNLWLLGYNSDGSGTNFDAAFTDAKAFFDASAAAINVNPATAANINGAASGGAGLGFSPGNDPLRKIIIFITDGDPQPSSSLTDALETIATDLPGVEIFAFNVGLEDTSFTDQIDSGGEATFVPDDDPSQIRDGISANVASFVDLNPAHIIRDMLINPNSDGLGDTSVIGATFDVAAQTLYDEGFGLSFFWNNPSSKEAFKQQLETHIDARVYFDTTTGKWEIKLIRPDYTVGTLFTFDAATIIDWTSAPETPKVWELANQVTLEYTRRDNGKESSVTLTNIAGVQASGRIINEKVSMPGITWPPLANFVAQRELAARSLPITRGAFRAGYAPADLKPGSAFILNEPRVGISNMVCRVIEMEEPDGKDNSVLIRFATDVFSLNPENGSFAVEDVGEPPNTTALPPDVNVALELPYYDLVFRYGESEVAGYLTDDPDMGFWGAGCSDPGQNHISAQVSELDAGTYYIVGNAPFAPAFALKEVLGRLPTDTTFTADETFREGEIAVGDLLLIDEEIVRVDSIAIADGVSTFTIGRGCLDTAPRAHAAGAYAIAYQDYVASDEVLYTAGEAITVKIAPQTSSDIVSLDDLTAEDIYFDSRAFRPYGPGQLKINSSYDPGLVGGTADAEWVHRDRLQQTTSSVEDHTSATIGPEAGTTYEAVRRLLFVKQDFFSSGIVDFFAQVDVIIDEENFTEVSAEVDSPSDGTAHTFDTSDQDFFEHTDVFGLADWYFNTFTERAIRLDLGIKALRGSSPVYENWQTPFVRVSPLLPAINLTAEDI